MDMRWRAADVSRQETTLAGLLKSEARHAVVVGEVSRAAGVAGGDGMGAMNLVGDLLWPGDRGLEEGCNIS